jgi:hypothetical protein
VQELEKGWGEKEPEGQEGQDDKPVELLNVPATQLKHRVLPAVAAYWPIGQGLHDV